MRARRGNSGIWAAATVAAALLVSFGACYRLLSARYARASESTQIPAGTLSALPLVLGDWVGTDAPLDEWVIRATDTQDHVSRTYRKAADEIVALFVGYGVNLRDLAPHRPEVCYPGAGWSLDRTDRVDDLPVDGGPPLSCQIHTFQRGGLVGDRVTVLNYYIVDGDYCSDVSLLRSRAWRKNSSATYAAQVQIVCQTGISPTRAEEAVRSLAADSAQLIRNLLVSAVETAVTNGKGSTAGAAETTHQ